MYETNELVMTGCMSFVALSESVLSCLFVCLSLMLRIVRLIYGMKVYEM